MLFSITQYTWDNTYCESMRCRSHVSPDDVDFNWLFLHKQACIRKLMSGYHKSPYSSVYM
jgi:hypothetical protein